MNGNENVWMFSGIVKGAAYMLLCHPLHSCLLEVHNLLQMNALTMQLEALFPRRALPLHITILEL